VLESTLLVGQLIFCPWLIGWMCQPLKARARGTTAVRRFRLVDLLALMLLLQACLAGLAWFLPRGHAYGWLLAGALVVFVVAISWWGGVELISRAGIDTAWRRLTFLGGVLPLVFAGALATGFALRAMLLRALNDQPAYSAAVMLVAVPWAGRWLVAWVADGPLEVAPSGKDR
jgi:hypothetical protein